MSQPVVETSAGKLRGTTERGIHRFAGVPYGEPTGGERRFKRAAGARAWGGVRDASEFGPICPQLGSLVDPAQSDAKRDRHRALPAAERGLSRAERVDAGPGRRRGAPVMVWLHGRGFSAGAGSETWYDGANLARRGDAVVITVNHRLNAFGYLHLADSLGEEFSGSGIAGLLDVVLALEWVRDNAAAFGGDPNNVTIFGESGGGAKVSTHARAARREGLVPSRGRAERAGPARRGARDRAGVHGESAREARDPARGRAQAAAGAAAGSCSARSPSCRPGSRGTGPFLLGAPAMFQLSPVVDGSHFPVHPFHPAAAPSGAAVPLMIGTNLDEAAHVRGRGPEAAQAHRGRSAPAARADAGRQARPRARHLQAHAPGGDARGTCSSRSRRADAHHVDPPRRAEGGGGPAPVFLYLFAWQSDFMGGLFKAAHALEIPFVFDNVEGVPITGDRPDKGALANTLSETWLAFARFGDPNHAGIPTWRPYTKERRDTMILDVPCRLEQAPRQDELDAWRDIEVRR